MCNQPVGKQSGSGFWVDPPKRGELPPKIYVATSGEGTEQKLAIIFLIGPSAQIANQSFHSPHLNLEGDECVDMTAVRITGLFLHDGIRTVSQY